MNKAGVKSGALKTISALVGAIFLAGCMATTNGGQGQSSTSGSGYDRVGFLGLPETDGGCNNAVAMGLGALAGALLNKENRAAGAAIGAAIGGGLCFAINYNVKQTKTAQQSEKDYQLANKGKPLPAQTQVVYLDSKMSKTKLSSGDQTQSLTTVEIVKGSSEPSVALQERLTLFKPDGTKLQEVVKTINPDASSGEYQSQFTIPMPKGVPDGLYPVKSEIVVNGEVRASKSKGFQIAVLGSTSEIVLASQ